MPHILSTKTLRDKELNLLQAKGYTCEVVEPFTIEYEAVSLTGFSQVELCVATSRHALIALTQNQEVFTAAQKLPWACIAPSTADYAEALGINVVIRAFQAKNLARKIIAKAQGKVLHLKGNDSLDVVEKELHDAGLEMKTQVVYRKIPNREIVLEKPLDAVLVFSPNSLSVLQEVLNLSPEIPLYCIGPTTAYRAIELGFVNIFYPAKPDVSKLIKLLK